MEFDFGARIAAKKQQASSAVGHGQVDEIPVIGGDGMHRDMEELADRLVQIFQPELRSDFGGTEFEPELQGSPIDLCDGYAPSCEAEVAGGEDDEVQFRLAAAEGKSGPAEDFIRRVADALRAASKASRIALTPL
jgi:hypothetical protein